MLLRHGRLLACLQCMLYHGLGQVILAEVETGQLKFKNGKLEWIYKILTKKNIS